MGTAARRRNEVKTRVPALARRDSVEVDRQGAAFTLSRPARLRGYRERSAEADRSLALASFVVGTPRRTLRETGPALGMVYETDRDAGAPSADQTDEGNADGEGYACSRSAVGRVRVFHSCGREGRG